MKPGGRVEKGRVEASTYSAVVFSLNNRNYCNLLRGFASDCKRLRIAKFLFFTDCMAVRPRVEGKRDIEGHRGDRVRRGERCRKGKTGER